MGNMYSYYENPNDPYVYIYVLEVHHTLLCPNFGKKNYWDCECNYAGVTKKKYIKCSQVSKISQLCGTSPVNIKKYKSWKKYIIKNKINQIQKDYNDTIYNTIHHVIEPTDHYTEH